MADYPAMYQKLLAVQVDAINKLQELMDFLIQAHIQVEELYINASQPDIVVLKPSEIEKNNAACKK